MSKLFAVIIEDRITHESDVVSVFRNPVKADLHAYKLQDEELSGCTLYYVAVFNYDLQDTQDNKILAESYLQHNIVMSSCWL